MSYRQFLETKSHFRNDNGFKPLFMPSFLFDFQASLVEWGCLRGRSATFADCGLGKTPMQLVWAENVVRHTNKPVLILTPMTVAPQTIAEAAKFGIEAEHSRDGKYTKKLVVTNYERLPHFNQSEFAGVVCDESGILKNFDGARRNQITQFMLKTPYRALYTATPAPNDYIELGTSSEALGQLGHMDMLSMFFKNSENSLHPIWFGARWIFKAHAETDFWRWVCSWARAIRKPSDLGFDDQAMTLPKLHVEQHTVKNSRPLEGELFPVEAVSLKDQRKERRATIETRCQMVAELASMHSCSIVWAHLNDEADLCEKLIPNARQISGATSEEEREEIVDWFVNGSGERRLVTKPVVCGFGMNFQHCNHMTVFPSHSWEQYHQLVRRCWRFGQKREVYVDMVTSQGEQGVLKNLQRKEVNAEKMFAQLVLEMKNFSEIKLAEEKTTKIELPSWIKAKSKKK